MALRLVYPVVFLMLLGCAQGAKRDLPKIKEARSIAAEWAMVNEQALRGNVRDTYVTTMRQQVRDELTTAGSSITIPQAVDQLRQLLAEPDDAPPDRLRRHVEQLKMIEDQLESA